MPPVDTALIVLAGIALFAAFVNGAIGYGFSSLTVPVALVFYTNRILNPAVVAVEVLINLYVLFINRDGIPAVSHYCCFGSPRLGQTRHLHGYSAPHPDPGSRLAQADSLGLDNRSPFWNGVGRLVFGNNHLRPPLSDFV
jgi:hypothetical protein